MKLNVAWADALSQNSVFKSLIFSLLILVVILSVALVKSSLTPPLILERGCLTEVASPASNERLPYEIGKFIELALSQRFDTAKKPTPGFLSPEEEKSREVEQDELKNKNIVQRVLFNSVVKIEKGEITVDADRFFSVGIVRSGFPFPLKVTVVTTSRSEANPYGLVLTKTIPIKKEE